MRFLKKVCCVIYILKIRDLNHEIRIPKSANIQKNDTFCPFRFLSIFSRFKKDIFLPTPTETRKSFILEMGKKEKSNFDV